MLALGLVIYLVSYGPLITHVLPNGDELVEKDPIPVGLALVAGLLAGVSLLPKAKDYAGVFTVIATVGALLLIEDAIGATGRGWALWAAVAAAVVQSSIAASALLLEAGVITPPAPRPKYDQYGHYGQYGYYGQQAPYQQSGYGAQYGGYPTGPTTGGFSAQPGPQPSSPQSQQHGSPTPPTGFPSFSPPPSSSGSGSPGQGKLRGPRRLRSRPALLRPGSAAAGSVLAVGPVTVLTVRCRARRLAYQGICR